MGNDGNGFHGFSIFQSFQSTFPRGERLYAGASFPPSIAFNPRSRVGNDAIAVVNRLTLGLSIHVPAWGTTSTKVLPVDSFHFQSTFPRGERQYCSNFPLVSYSFNPRSRVGNDQVFFPHSPSTLTFNPRSRVGNDLRESEHDVSRFLSIHVPAWGTTFWKSFCYGQYNLSIHVPAWGTTLGSLLYDICAIFQSTFPRGERRRGIG